MSSSTATPAPATDQDAANLQYTDTEDALRDSVRRLFADRVPLTDVARSYDTPAPDFAGVWRTFAELGLAGLLVPENIGGAGASEREAAVVCEEIGRAVAPIPFLSSAVLATVTLLRAGDTEHVATLADGSRVGALAVPLSATSDSIGDAVSLRDGRLHGSVTTVAGAAESDLLVVPVVGDSGLEIRVVETTSTGVTVTPALGLDMTRPIADITFDGASGVRVNTDDAAGAVHAAMQTGAALLASEQYGAASWCLETTLAYVKDRKQFGRTIGSYQAIKHRLADLWLQVSSAGAAARYAADTAARGDADAAVAAHVAASFCGDVAVKAAEECIQLHGGIGMTWEYPAHLFLKRAKSDQIALGTGYWHRARLAELVDLPAHPSAG
ncbi:acyl-CoA dehydrogenase family protein [Gordonia sp. CPCC 205515]|uniref:acyl-CoA dehydrogenase family protein n=1 Tax=Gordonia sp. CPCC 205515 TaxID=3140791 RepID=UPI003AF354B3